MGFHHLTPPDFFLRLLKTFISLSLSSFHPSFPIDPSRAEMRLPSSRRLSPKQQQQQQQQQTRRRSVSYQLRQTSVGGVKWDRRKIWGRLPEMCCINCDIEKKWI